VLPQQAVVLVELEQLHPVLQAEEVREVVVVARRPLRIII